MRLAGKRVLVTGASQGIGAAAASRYAERGAHVLLVARSAEGLKRQVERITEFGGSAEAITADLANADEIRSLGESVEAPDVLVNNAGIGRWLFLDDTSPDELQQMTAVPYQAALLLTRAFLGDMRERGSGWIVNVNSPVSRLPIPGATGYASARWALRGLTASLRLDLRGTGVGISEVVPGKVSSQYFENNPGAEERIPRIAKLIPTVTPDRVADAMVAAVEKEKAEIHLPWQLKAFELSGRIFPGLTSYLTWKTGTHR
ncbi:SDR family NAD(P)-dependent oxidoreductase [Lentzea tibetensis]|uniref:SDR family NAD(P)-dependent oxidoreductase n=1 Tax=Lentzea tibetensis TaxID=2591470 RepID=A0A563EZ40_9PSEU|nr:SDR family NAD(P)-dependent oxidoreductase [Lentzea tibetensis]TWP52812.1 SDR family NAD(P)-dependent oxidoreductase [Lentzea tibetensis]